MALVDAYHEAVTGAADPVAATQDGAVAAGDAVDLPHLGRCPVPNIVPAVARPGVNGDGEALGNGYQAMGGCQDLVGLPLLRS